MSVPPVSTESAATAENFNSLLVDHAARRVVQAELHQLRNQIRIRDADMQRRLRKIFVLGDLWIGISLQQVSRALI